MEWRNRVKGVLERNVRVFGEDITHTPLGGSPLPRKGIFNDIFKGIDPQSGFQVVSQEPNLGIKLFDWTPPPAQGDAIQLRGINYKVDRVELDGEGGAVCYLLKNINQVSTPDKRSGFFAAERILERSVSVFGTAVVHEPVIGGVHTLRGIFNDRYEGVDPETGFITVTEQPNLGIRLSQWPTPPVQGDFISVYGQGYQIRHIEVDGEGGATLILDKITGILPPGTLEFNEDFSLDFA